MSRDFGNVESPRRVRSQHYQNRLQQLQQQQLQLQQQQQQLPWQQQQQQQLPWQQQQHPPASSRRHPVSPTGGRHQHPAYAASGSVAEVAPREDRREDLRSGQAPSPPTTDNNGLLDLVRFHPNSGELSLSLQGVPRRMRKGDRGSPRITEDLLTRTSWVDAALAHRQIKKGKLLGNSRALWVRARLQSQLFSLGCFIHKHSGKVLFVGLLLLSLCCVGLKTATMEMDVQKLWVEAGGRLEKELAYTKKALGEGHGTTAELVLQTSLTPGDDILRPDSLLRHYAALHAATQIHVNMLDTTWTFKDMCYASSFPPVDDSGIFEGMLETLLPCVIITPLDCFWEGSKLLGPDHGMRIPWYPGEKIKWSNLNPQELLEKMAKIDLYGYVSVDVLQNMFDRAGITTAYQKKPCLNPYDPECPDTAPNKHNKQAAHIGAEMTGGCQGFATKYMQWDEGLIVGGVSKNKSGYIVKAEALQSIVQLLGEQELYEYHRDTYKVQYRDWTPQTAKILLETWQRKFTQEITRVMEDMSSENQTTDEVLPFSTTSLMDLLQDFSQMSTIRVVLGYVLMLVYACISMMRWSDAVRSQGGIGIVGVILVALSVAAGLGICCVLGIKFNASTTQIIPFLALGLGVDDMFLIAHTYAEFAMKEEIPYSEQTGHCLKQTGVSVMLTSLSNICAFFLAAIIPIPALRAFALQAGILLLFNLLTILLVYPAVISLDLARKEDDRVDVFCCFRGSNLQRVMSIEPDHQCTPPPEYRERSPPPPYNPGSQDHPQATVTQTSTDGSHPVTTLAPQCMHSGSLNQVSPVSSLPPSTTSSRQCLTPDDNFSCHDRCIRTHRECCSWSLTWFAKRLYGPMLQKTPVKILVMVSFGVLLIFGITGTTKMKDGLELTDVMPRSTREYRFFDTQSKYFGFYYFFAVVKEDIDIPTNQQLLHQYHQSFQYVEKIVKREDGTLPDFWLKLMRDWLLDIQYAFDVDLARNLINEDGWHKNATDKGILGYKLIIQTGELHDNLNKKRVHSGRLVNEDGIIYPPAFYTYLTAWNSNDMLASSAAMPNFHPIPREWYSDRQDRQEENLKIQKSQPLVYSQLPFYLNNMVDTEEVTDTIKEIRGICESFEAKGLPNYPSGVPFTFWEQYLHLRFYMMLALVCALVAIFLVLTLVLMNPWMAFIVVVVLSMMVVELFGIMGLAGLKLSAVPAVVLIVSVGIGVEFTVHVCLGFLTAVGSRDRRMRIALEHMFAPVIHGAMTTLLGVIMLAGAEFDFIVKYFFVVLLVLVVLGLLNGLMLLPVILSLIGPAGEVIPRDGSDRIEPPSPEPSPKPLPRRPHRSRRVQPRIPSDISLTTITEEPSQYSSHEIVVQPEVVVETTVSSIPSSNTQSTTTTTTSNPDNTASSTSSHNPSTSTTHVTRVKACAKVMVEVHTPLPGAVEYKSRKRKVEASSSDSEEDSFA